MKNKKLDIDCSKGLVRGIEGLFEITAMSVLYYFVWRYGYSGDLFPDYMGYGKYVLSGIYGLLLTFFMFSYDGFKFGYLRLSEVMVSQGIAMFIADFITYWQLCLIANTVISPAPILALFLLNIIVSFCCTYVFSIIYHRIYAPKKMVMVFGNDDAVTLKFKMDTRSDKYHITKLISADEGLERICRKIQLFDAVVINDIPAELRNDILKFCYHEGIRTYVAPKLTDIIIRGGKSINLFDTPLLLVKGRGITGPQLIIKRTADIILCSLALVIASPIMALVALAIKLEDGGPVFFKQKRQTLGGKVFEILKFRSMIVNAEQSGIAVPATERDPRITRVGSFIRATRLDELPQLINIIWGDMSIVGPRPERVEHMEKYGELISEFDFRLKVRGGLTGYAQIYGKYNTSPYDKLRLDLMYIENYSILLDIKLILTTLRIMLKKESTEGFDKAEELERLKQEALEEMRQAKLTKTEKEKTEKSPCTNK